MGSQQYFINMWSLVSSVKLSPMKKPVSTETKLEKENAIHATPFGNQLDSPQHINYVHSLVQSQIQPVSSTTSPLTRRLISKESAEEFARWVREAGQQHCQQARLIWKTRFAEAGWAPPPSSSPSAAAIWSPHPPRVLSPDINGKRPWSWGHWRRRIHLFQKRKTYILPTQSMRLCFAEQVPQLQ